MGLKPKPIHLRRNVRKECLDRLPQARMLYHAKMYRRRQPRAKIKTDSYHRFKHTNFRKEPFRQLRGTVRAKSSNRGCQRTDLS